MSWVGLEDRSSDVFVVFQLPGVFFQGTRVLCDPSRETRCGTLHFQVYDIGSTKCTAFFLQPTVKVFNNEISHQQFICRRLPDVGVATDVAVGLAVFHPPWHGDKSSQLGGQAAHLMCRSNVDADGNGVGGGGVTTYVPTSLPKP